MRKIFKSFMLVAAAAMAFTSCQKEETAAPETVSATLTMHADVEQTKTYLGEDNAVIWGKGEAVKLYVGSGETAKFFDSASTDDYNGEASASFTFAIEDVAQADSYALGGIYPASAAVDDNKNAAQYKVILPATQNQVDGNYDPSAYIMVLKPEMVYALPTEYTASFRRAVALNKITLTGVQEDISSVEITVPEKKYLAGRRYMNLTTGESGEVYESGTQTNVVKVNGDFKSGSFDVWFCSWGVELVEDEALTVKMASANNTYTRTITTRAEGIKFVEGDLNTLTINMASAEVEAITTIAGDYLIASKTSSGWFLMTPTNGGKFYSATTSVSSSSTVTCADFYDVADVDNYVWNVAKYDNGYSIKSVNTNKYITYSGSSNEAYANEELSYAAKMDIQLTDQSAVIESMNVSGRKLQYNASSPRFAFYTTAQTGVYLIPWTPDTTPRITLAKNSDQVAYDATSYEFTYSTKNITGELNVAVEDGATMNNVKASASNGTVTVTFDANADTESKTATIVLSYEGAESQEFVLTQAGKPVEGGESTVATWSWDGGVKSDFTGGNIYKTYGLGSDYAASHAPYQIKMDGTGDYFIIKVDGAIQSASVGVKMIGGASPSTLQVLGSSDGDSFTSVEELSISGSQNAILELVTTKQFDPSYRYLKFNFIKGTNIGVGPITITYIPENSEGGETPEPDPTPDPEPETPTYASLEELVAAGQPTTDGTKVNVTLTDEEITSIYVTSSGYRNGVFLQVGEQEIEIYSHDVPEEWVVGGTISGTLTECVWKLYNTTWELCPSDWSELTYTAPAEESPEPDPTPDPEQPGQGGDAGVVVLSEQFDNSTESDSNTEIKTSEFPNFSGATSKAYTSQYGGIKLGSSKASGYITSKSLDLSSSFTVQIDACKYGSDTGNIVVTVDNQTQTISNSELDAAGTFKTFTLSFDAATATSTVKIATSSKRAYIDNVIITKN